VFSCKLMSYIGSRKCLGFTIGARLAKNGCGLFAGLQSQMKFAYGILKSTKTLMALGGE
jgi:hypothetical protein